MSLRYGSLQGKIAVVTGGGSGFGAEIAAVVSETCFLDMDAPVSRLAMPDIPSPHNPALMEWALPSVASIRAKIEELVGF